MRVLIGSQLPWQRIISMFLSICPLNGNVKHQMYLLGALFFESVKRLHNSQPDCRIKKALHDKRGQSVK